MTELLSRCTKMPVVQIENSIKVDSDPVYVIAPNQELTIKDGVVRTNKPSAPRGHRHPVDSFFRSLADDQGERAIAIVLSGTGTNGSVGLRCIKAEGGIAIAQDPDTAAFQGMPRSAVGTGVVDLVLPPRDDGIHARGAGGGPGPLRGSHAARLALARRADDCGTQGGGESGPFEKQCFRKDGSRIWIHCTGKLLSGGIAVEFIDVTDRKRAEEERGLLTQELSHRVRNALAVVQSLAMQTDGRTPSVEAFREAFVGRLQALARAHGLLLDTNWRSADLKTLVEQATAAYRGRHPEVIEIEGEPVTITPKQGLGLSLLLHELGTNAVKHGALSQPEGRLRVSWVVENDPQVRRVRLTWQERGGPRPEPLGEKGFGTQRIERACAYELEGEVELDYAPEGLICEVVFPLL